MCSLILPGIPILVYVLGQKPLATLLLQHWSLQVAAEDDVVNQSWDVNGASMGLADTIGIMGSIL
jgi:hypothetical protein